MGRINMNILNALQLMVYTRSGDDVGKDTEAETFRQRFCFLKV